MPFFHKQLNRSRLSPEQKQDAAADLIGFRPEHIMSDDQKQNVFDINKPPVTPYEHQEFPKMLYDHRSSKPARVRSYEDGNKVEHEEHIAAKIVSKVANDAEEEKALIDAGYSAKPPEFTEEAKRKR